MEEKQNSDGFFDDAPSVKSKTDGESVNEPVEQKANGQVEKENYSADSLKRVEKLRSYGKRINYDVPYLEYPLTKPEKKRKRYVALAISLYVIAAALVVLALGFIISMVPKFVEAGADIDSSSPDWDELGIISGFAGMSLFAAGVLLFGILGTIALIGVYLLFSAKKCLNLSTATEEEMAHGVVMNGVVLKTSIAALVGIAVFIVCTVLSKDKAKFFSGFTPYVLLAIAGLLVGIAVVVIKDRFNAVKKFNELPDNVRESHSAHFNALKRVKSKKEIRDNNRRRIWW